MPGLGPEEVGFLALSLKVALVSVLASLPVAIVVAYVLARFSFPGKTLFDAVVHLPLVLPPVVEEVDDALPLVEELEDVLPLVLPLEDDEDDDAPASGSYGQTLFARTASTGTWTFFEPSTHQMS